MTEADKKRIKPHLTKMAHYCSMQERAISEVVLKLRSASLSAGDVDYIIERLKKEGFLDEFRYAKAFVNDKFKLNSWGKIKIGYALRMKHVDSEAVEEALRQIGDEDYQNLLIFLVSKKMKEVKSTSSQDRNNKVARFLLQRGFEPDWVWKAIQATD